MPSMVPPAHGSDFERKYKEYLKDLERYKDNSFKEKEMSTYVTFATALLVFKNVFISASPPEIAAKLGMRCEGGLGLSDEFANKWRAMNQIASALTVVSPEEIEVISEKHYIQSEKVDTISDAVRAITALLLFFGEQKEGKSTDGRSPKTRHCAVVYTLLEQVLAYIVYYLK
jgi:hypothetical protein